MHLEPLTHCLGPALYPQLHIICEEQSVADLELEQLLKLLLHFAGVAAAAPVAGQPVRVSHHFQQRQLWLKCNSLLGNEAPANGQHNAQSGSPPASNSQRSYGP